MMPFRLRMLCLGNNVPLHVVLHVCNLSTDSGLVHTGFTQVIPRDIQNWREIVEIEGFERRRQCTAHTASMTIRE